MEIDEREVVKSWLRHELEKRGREQEFPGRDEAVEMLYKFKKESRAVLRKVERWEIREISLEDYEEMFVFPSERWRRFASGDGEESPTVLEAAKRVKSGEEISEEVREAVDVDKIEEIAEKPRKDMEIRPVLAYYRDESLPSLFDGNHRAVASALKVLRGEDSLEMEAMVGQNQGDGVTDWDCEKCVPAEGAGKL